jgi:hypothetical protein
VEAFFFGGGACLPGTPDPDPLPWVESLLTAAGSARIGGKYQCPVHATEGEHSVSLKLARGRNGGLLLFCHAGCDFRDILRALRLPGSVLMYPPPTDPATHARFYLRRLRFPEPRAGAGSLSERGFRFEAEHEYGTPPIAWKMRYRHPSTGEKVLRWESVNPRGERVPGLLGRRQVDLPIYVESDVRMSLAAGETVLLVESESSADALMKIGICTTTWAGGAADPALDRLRDVFGGYERLVVIPDNDTAGLACLAKLRTAGLAPHVAMPAEGQDARDLLAQLGRLQFDALIKDTVKETNR